MVVLILGYALFKSAIFVGKSRKSRQIAARRWWMVVELCSKREVREMTSNSYSSFDYSIVVHKLLLIKSYN